MELAPPWPWINQTPRATGVASATSVRGDGSGDDRTSAGAARSSIDSSTAFLSTYNLFWTTLRKSLTVAYPIGSITPFTGRYPVNAVWNVTSPRFSSYADHRTHAGRPDVASVASVTVSPVANFRSAACREPSRRML